MVDKLSESSDQLSTLSQSEKEELIQIYMNYRVYYDYCTYTPNNTYLIDPELPAFNVGGFNELLLEALDLPSDVPLTIRFRQLVSNEEVLTRINKKLLELDGSQLRNTNK